MRSAQTFLGDSRASAGAEMALVLPFLLVLMFGGLEAGHYFFREHQIVKAAREGARFAGRQSMDAYDCTAQSVDADTAEAVAELVQATVAGDPTVAVSVAPCIEDSSTGLYTGVANGAPIAIVTVSMEYPSLFSALGFDAADLTLFARSQSAVMGL
jgi:Flp pilus assembly protein TadG